ncbi:MAG: glutamine-hydrolyzing carbamoyl-phosphate synthase small subunit [Flavobacteriales bacterium]|jgi:carbamoyl-phosphate synthase small subunit|nr:glutamine-hydrolyzing carbamoyl-phosphate synthase small subunit [Flavobacteriales bacterium]
MAHTQTPAVILLKDGTVFKGLACGKIGTTTGEIAFNTGMTGYQEIFTDPSYSGQIVVMATAHIGNYGVEASEIESEGCKIKGLVTKKFSTVNSRYRETDTLQNYLEHDDVVGIMDVDTRALVRHIRDNGAQNAIISSETTDIEELKAQLDQIPSMKGMELASQVSTKETYTVGEVSAKYKIALLDFGVKKNIIRSLVERDCFVKVFPYNTSFEELKSFSPDGIMLSNGPGDPEPLTEVIDTVGQLVEADYPIFGICLGHQILAISQGLTTEKMYNGHRGINHPIKNLISGKSEITSQNHGFVVKMEEAIANENITITHQHLNDDTLAGIALKNKNAFSVQYHPESSPGPHDSRYLFDQFIANINKN